MSDSNVIRQITDRWKRTDQAASVQVHRHLDALASAKENAKARLRRIESQW